MIKEISLFLVQIFPFRVRVCLTGYLESSSTNHLKQLSRQIVFSLSEVSRMIFQYKVVVGLVSAIPPTIVIVISFIFNMIRDSTISLIRLPALCEVRYSTGTYHLRPTFSLR